MPNPNCEGFAMGHYLFDLILIDDAKKNSYFKPSPALIEPLFLCFPSSRVEVTVSCCPPVLNKSKEQDTIISF